MRSGLYLFIVLIFSVTTANGQASDPSGFEKYVLQQDSIFTASYKQRDTKTFETQLADFIKTLHAQPESVQKDYNNYLINGYYNLSCAYALLNKKKEALDYLDKSVKSGFRDYYHVLEDKDLDTLRKEPRYKTIVASLKAKGDYLFVLRNAATFNRTDKRETPKFTYQSSNDSNLVALRKAFNLDSIAGFGSQESRIINLMHWVHKRIPHDGNHDNPVVKNAVSMIAECQRDKRGLNCRGLATVLNEIYLAMGYESRFITCLPKDTTDLDCHVINMVYSTHLKKWLWMDPTWDAYVMNEKGELLSIEEVRDRLISNKPVIINPDANWNFRESATKEDYLHRYMAKNLYRLECPVRSQYDLETRQPGKTIEYIQLVPLDYHTQKPDVNKRGTKTTLVTYLTNNPAVLWTKSE